ncbi:hypothetical protein QYE76_035719 [Lolium multiflorum]|uniref:Transposase (putative) gypsy type domain-containing protein n=1 Tax=Lolium multiflorum TaxID=4521 RepID=A0AAD8R0A3_LOLMU|nr:hypothetical protein QYE76_035719 [Lolium multiflorum]
MFPGYSPAANVKLLIFALCSLNRLKRFRQLGAIFARFVRFSFTPSFSPLYTAPPVSSTSAVPELAGKSPEHHRSESTTVVFFVFLTPTSHRTKNLVAGEFDHRELHCGRRVLATRKLEGDSKCLSPGPSGQRDGAVKALVERGFSFPPSDFFLEILKAYVLQPHNISPNSVLATSNHVTLCEGHLRVAPELSLFQYYFTVKKERIRVLATCGTITFMIRPGRVYPHTDRHESARYWSAGFFYLKDVSDPANARKLPPFKNCPATELPTWSHCPHISESLQLTRAVRRICKLTEEGLTGKDLTLSWFTKRIQPLQHRTLDVPVHGRDDPMRVTKDNLSADALDKRIRVLIKVPRELHVHVCNKDIHMNGSGTALEALEENELGTLLRVPSTGNTDPDAASEAEAPEASRPAKRKKAAPSSPHAKRAREVPSTAATRRAEAEKKRLSLIDTSNKGQPDVQHFFKPSGSGSQPPKAPRAPKKKAKPSPASFPVTPEVEVPPKASSASKPDPKDIINVDDLPEDPAHHGDSAKGTSSPRHAEVSDMLNKVWGKPDEEVRELADLEDSLKEFFAKHREVRQTTRKLHEDLRVHVLEQITEIEGLRQNAENSQQAPAFKTAKHSKFDELSAKVQVLEAENESLKDFVKKSASQENQARKELIEKHARDLAELNEKLEKSQGRVISVISKNRVLEAEAEAIDKLIFPSLGFEWSKESNLKRTEAYDEARISIDALFEACRNCQDPVFEEGKNHCDRYDDQTYATSAGFHQGLAKVFSTRSRLPSPGHLQGSLPLAQPGGCCTRSPEDSDMGALLAETEGYEQLFVRRVDHSFWYNQHDLPSGFSDAEEEAGEPEYYGEGSGSSGEHSGGDSGDDSKAGSGDSDGGSTYQQSEEEDSE